MTASLWYELLNVLLYVPVAAALSWAAGFAIAVEDWIGTTRERIEAWGYVDPEGVSDGAPHQDAFWDRAKPVELVKEPEKPITATLKAQTLPSIDPGGRDVVVHVSWKPQRWVNRLATIARTKFADAIGCPHCSGWWGGLAVGMVAMVWFGPWDFSLPIVAAQFAGWGIARAIGWSH